MATRMIRDDVDKFLEYDVHLPTKTFYMGSCCDTWGEGESGTDFQMAERSIKVLHLLDNLPANGSGITIIMNNLGGDFYHGMAIYDAIQNCSAHVTVIATGYAMSMGSIILQAADTRLMMPSARMMIHYGWDSMGAAHHKDFMSYAEESKKLRDWMETLYVTKIQEQHADFNKVMLADFMNFDRYLSAQEAVDLGQADGIKYPPHHTSEG